MKKRVLSILVILIALTGLFPISANAITQSEFDSKLSTLKSQYPHGQAWNGSFDGGIECYGYAHMIAYKVFGSYAKNWTKSYDLSGVKAGDVIQYGNTTGSGHTIFVTSVSGNTITYTDCNSDYKNTVKWGSTISKTSNTYFNLYSFSYRCVAPSLTTDTTAPTITKVWFSDVTETSYKVHATITDNVGVTTTGFIHWSGRNGKDDQEWVETSYNSSTKTTTTTVLASKHNNELGTYYSNAHAYDAAGNHSVAELGYGVYLEKYLDLGTSFSASIKNTTVGKALTCDSSGNVTSRTYTGAQNQIWKFTKQSDKTYKIQNVGTGLCLDVENGSTEVGAKVLGYKSHAGDNQKWYIQGAQGSYRLRAKSCWCVLDLYGLNKNDGAAFDMYGSNGSDAQRFTITTISAVTKPVIAPVNIVGGKNVAITCATSGATIYYTTDGSTPTTSSKKYTTAFNVTSTATIKAIAVKSGYTNSEVASSTLTITKAATPVIKADGAKVTITDSTSGATIYYTTNGSNPTTSSTKYTAPFNVSSGTTVKAIAVASGYSNSSVASKTITIAQASDYAFTVTQTSSAATITNTSNKEQKAAVIITEYENGALKDVSSTNETFAAGEKKTYNFTGNGTHKVFVWNSLGGMVPMAK